MNINLPEVYFDFIMGKVLDTGTYFRSEVSRVTVHFPMSVEVRDKEAKEHTSSWR